MIETSNVSAATEFTFSRTFDASRQQVWNAFTQPEHLKHWWGPKVCSIEIARFEFHPNGIFLYSMKMPGGPPMWGRFIYREISAPSRLIFLNSFSDENGGLARNPWMSRFPLETLNTIVFTEENGKTTLTLTGGPINCTDDERNLYLANIDNMREGFGGSFDVLAAYLPQIEDTSNRELRSTRIFDAPRDLVFRMWTEPEHLKRWWGPNGFTITIHKIDVRPGGEWDFIMHGPDGRDFPNHKRYLVVDPPNRLVFEHTSEPRHRWKSISPRDGKTEVAVHLVFESPEVFSYVVREYHADEVLTQTLNRLGEQLAKL
jgi:uncharacterized protein YndB with AHSA1/START domain